MLFDRNWLEVFGPLLRKEPAGAILWRGLAIGVGIGSDEKRRDDTRLNETKRDGIGWDGTGWDGMG